ncbi:MAG: cysteine desulfurase family protein [Alphaproteobacteria bacterium]|nr:cysteine desulfurase family protein [Alphaproteobacteria bacterium]
MIYLDANATAVMKPAVRAAMLEAMERHGNPSSVHRYGRIARRSVDEARAHVAALAGAKPAQVIFTSGGTEANNLILGSFDNRVVSVIEHDSVLAFTGETRLPVTRNGIVDVNAAEEILRDVPKGALISVMLVNNETGVIQPVAEIAALAKKFGHIMHSDAIQAAGRLPIDFAGLGVDALTLSAHKIGGPQGMGALIVRDGLVLKNLIKGGGQERNRRAGTENVAGIVGFGCAALLAADDLLDMPRLAALRDQLQIRLQHIAGEDAVVAGQDAPRVANTLSIALIGMKSETQVASMDLSGVAVSAGSACSSGKVKASHVLKAMGYDADVAGGALRISLGWHSEATDIERCADAWREIYERARRSARPSQAA